MKILVNGEEKELNYYKAGCTRDIIGNSGFKLEYDNDLDQYTMSLEDYNWWNDFFTFHNETVHLWESFKNSLDLLTVELEVYDEIEAKYHSMYDTDYDCYPRKQQLLALLEQYGYTATYYSDNSIGFESNKRA